MGFVLGVTAETVWLWLERAAHKAHTMNAHLLQALPVTQLTDPVWTLCELLTAKFEPIPNPGPVAPRPGAAPP
jgi:hypothetical protein